MEEENKSADPVDLGKFKSVDALVRAYGELEAEFTRRSQRLKALEQQLAPEGGDTHTPQGQEELYRAVTENGELCARIACDYLRSLRGAPLMAGEGTGVAAPVKRPATIAEAGDFALGYLRNQNK